MLILYGLSRSAECKNEDSIFKIEEMTEVTKYNFHMSKFIHEFDVVGRTPNIKGHFLKIINKLSTS